MPSRTPVRRRGFGRQHHFLRADEGILDYIYKPIRGNGDFEKCWSLAANRGGRAAGQFATE